MIKRIIVALFLVLSFAAAREAELLNTVIAQKTRSPKKTDYGKFTHASHKGQVKSLINKAQSIELDCAYCHGSAVKDKQGKDLHDIETMGYPSHKQGLAEAKTHSACIECHSFTGSAMPRQMCAICHDKLTLDPKLMATNLRRFPNPEAGISQFYDFYSHSEHVDFFEQYVSMTPLKSQLKFFDSKQDAKANKGLDKNRYECAACHTMTQAPSNAGKLQFAAGVKMSAPGHPECFVCHFDPKIITPPKPDKPNPKNTFATNCVGCHQDAGKPLKDGRPVKGAELAVNWFARQIVNTELNPVKPGVKAPLPFSHKTHDDAVGKSVSDCLSCHATGKAANTRSDFYLADRKTKENQPLAWSCVDCHKKEMQTRIEGAVTLEGAKCNYCHALKTVKEYKAKGVQLPPANHFWKKPAPTPTPAPKP